MPEYLVEDQTGIARAAALLRAGELVALPTETVYGLAADACNADAVARVFAAKGRPAFNPLIVHVATRAEAEAIAVFDSAADTLAQAFWPGPLTLVLPLRDGHALADAVTAGLPTVALRLPAHPAMHAVLSLFGGPLAAPSANPSGQISPTEARHVRDAMGGRVAAILDGGACAVGLESTIVKSGVVLREGGLAREEVEAVTGPLAADRTPGRIEAPGQMSSHYAPQAMVFLGGPAPDGAVTIGFGAGVADFSLSATGEVEEAASRLFAVLHAADALAAARKTTAIHVAEIPEVGLGRAINDRLRRAAAPRG